MLLKFIRFNLVVVGIAWKEEHDQTKGTVVLTGMTGKYFVTSRIIGAKFKLKLFTNFNQNVDFYLENLEVTFFIIYASSRTSLYKIAITGFNSQTAYISIGVTISAALSICLLGLF